MQVLEKHHPFYNIVLSEVWFVVIILALVSNFVIEAILLGYRFNTMNILPSASTTQWEVADPGGGVLVCC